MKKVSLFFMPMFSLILSSIVAATSPAPPSLSKLLIEPCEFGEAYQFSSPSCEIELVNVGDKDIHVLAATGVKPDDRISPPSFIVHARETKKVRTTSSVGADVGFSKHFFALVTDEVGQEKRFAEAKGFVLSLVDNFKPELDFGVVDLLKQLPVLKLDLKSADDENLKILRILDAPPYLQVTISEDRKSIEAKVKNNAPWGLFQKDHVVVEINSSLQRRVSVSVKADFRGNVVPSLNPVPIGYIRNNVENSFSIRLLSNTGRKFTVGKIDVSGFSASASAKSCIPESDGCKDIRVLISPDQPTGQVGGLISIQLPEFGKSLAVYAWGMLLTPGVKIIDLNEEMNRRDKASEDGSGGAAMQPDLGAILKAATKKEPAELPPPIGRGPLVKWAVANEQMLYGYFIFRAKSEDGPYVRLNHEIIRVQPGDSGAGLHQWRDNSAVPGKEYWYYVGYIERSGRRDRLTTPQRAMAK